MRSGPLVLPPADSESLSACFGRTDILRVVEPTTWTIGAITIERVPYFDIGLDPESLGLAGVAESVDWAEPWMIDGQPGVGQAFWILRTGDEVIVVDPCGASDAFLRSGPEAVSHQEAAFNALVAAGCEPDSVTKVVFSHLDGIGMAALADGSDAGQESWRPAFANSALTIAAAEYQFILAGWSPAEPAVEGSGDEGLGDDGLGDDGGLLGRRAFLQLDAQDVVRPVDMPAELAPGISMTHTGGHSPGHAIITCESEGQRAVLIGHLAINPLHAATGHRDDLLHADTGAGWQALEDVLNNAHEDQALVIGPLFPSPGAARVAATGPFKLVPTPGE